jgi:hypothetical protein
MGSFAPDPLGMGSANTVLSYTLCPVGTHKSYSVLGQSTTSAGPDRFAHFFASPDAYILFADPTVWFNDRFFLTVPMLFTLAYTLAVFLRDHMPRQPATTLEPTPEPADPIPADTLGS